MKRPDPHASYRQHVSSEAEAVEENNMLDPSEHNFNSPQPTSEIESLRAQLATARKALENGKFRARMAVRSSLGPRERKIALAFESFCKETHAALNSGEQKQSEDWPYPEGNPTCAQDLK